MNTSILIIILLFLSIPSNMKSELVNISLVIQVIILSAFVMMFGLMLLKNKPKILGPIHN